MARRRLGWVLAFSLACVVGLGMLRWYRQDKLDQALPRGLSALRDNDLPAVRDAAHLLESHPDREHQSAAHLLRGALYMRRSAWHAALEEFSQVIPEGEVRFPTLLMTGEGFYRVGQIMQAEAIFRQLALEDPENVFAHRWLGAIYYDLGANEQAITELKRVIELAPTDYSPHRLIALMRMDFEDYSEATEHYRKALELRPPAHVREELLVELGSCLIKQRHYPAAVEVLAQAIPTAEALALLSESHWSLGDRETAQQLLERARDLDPQNRTMLYLHARVELDGGDPAEAARALQEIIKQDPVDKDATYQLALAYQRLGDDQRHTAQLARWNELNEKYQRLSDLSQAAIEDPRNPEIRDQLAEGCAALGKNELASMWRRVASALRAGQTPSRAGVAGESGLPPSGRKRQTPLPFPVQSIDTQRVQ